MELITIRHKIANIRRHYGLDGNDMLACYDTAISALIGHHPIDYVTVSISPSNWKDLSNRVDPSCLVKHPGSNVECIRVFNDVYIRKEVRVPDQDVVWSKYIGCFTPTARKLMSSMEAITLAKSSTRKQIEHANRVMTKMLVHPNLKDAEV